MPVKAKIKRKELSVVIFMPSKVFEKYIPTVINAIDKAILHIVRSRVLMEFFFEKKTYVHTHPGQYIT